MCFYISEVSDIAYKDFGGVYIAEVDTEGTLHQTLIIALTITDSPIMYTCIMIVATEVYISKSGFHL